MRTKVILQKYLLGLIAILTFISAIPTSAQQSMNLGDLKFVMPSANAVRSNRTLHMKMARTGISNRIVAKVGGVAFIQTAEPEFVVNSLQLGVNADNNNAYVIINDTTYEIPLEVWELQSIVEYANQEDNAAVTLFGDNDSRIKYHDAFLDNLMGLRILQTDLILTQFLRPTDIGKLPAYSDGSFILSPKEKEFYESLNSLDSLLLDVSYEELSLLSYYQVVNIIDSIGEYYDSYIYTDYNEPIKFYTTDKSIKFNGLPYYRFTTKDPSLIDTLEMYYELKNFVDTFNLKKNKYQNLCISNVFKKSENPTIYKLMGLTKKNANILKKAEKAFNLTNYYATSDSLELCRDYFFIRILDFAELKSSVNTFSDSIARLGSGIPELDNICNEYLSVRDSLKFEDYPIITAYANMMYSFIPNDSAALHMYSLSDSLDLTYDRLLIEHMYLNKIPVSKTTPITTDYFRNNRDNIYFINPLVFDAADKTCQWSAFFRYIKENFNDTWRAFTNNVKTLSYDAPIVQTPIDFVFSR